MMLRLLILKRFLVHPDFLAVSYFVILLSSVPWSQYTDPSPVLCINRMVLPSLASCGFVAGMDSKTFVTLTLSLSLTTDPANSVL